jgi:uncharacterized protein
MASAALRAFLEHPDREKGTLIYDELPGFLFAIANAPEVILPSEWIPEVFGGEMPVFEDIYESDAINELLIAEYDEVNTFSLTIAEGELPPGCHLRADPMKNLEDGARITDWAQGFLIGYRWLGETWNSYLPLDEPNVEQQVAELTEELGFAAMVLTFFSSRTLAEAFVSETGGMDLARMADTMCDAFPSAVHAYIAVGRSFQQAYADLQEPYRRTAPKVGRNDPCPCGSGKKYKRCCGAAA